jgi:hypothetical protein
VFLLSQREQLTALHQGQVRAYREAGRIALMEWADAFQLPSATTTEDNKDDDNHHQNALLDVSAYQKLCRTMAERNRPNWQVNKPIIAQALQRIEERAIAEYTLQQKQKAANEKQTIEDAAAGEEAADEEEDGEIEENEEDEEEGAAENDDNGDEEGEIDEEQKDESKSTLKTPEKGRKANVPTTKKGQLKSGKSVTAVKKKGPVKVTSNAAARGRRGRGPGRGGARSTK